MNPVYVYYEHRLGIYCLRDRSIIYDFDSQFEIGIFLADSYDNPREIGFLKNPWDVDVINNLPPDQPSFEPPLSFRPLTDGEFEELVRTRDRIISERCIEKIGSRARILLNSADILYSVGVSLARKKEYVRAEDLLVFSKYLYESLGIETEHIDQCLDEMKN